MNIREKTLEAENLYTWLCRLIEQDFHYTSDKEEFIETVKQAPLYLWSREKESVVEQYYDDKGISIFNKIKLPVIMSTKNCCCVLAKQSFPSEDQTKFETFLIALDGKQPPHLTSAHGILTIETIIKDGRENFEISFQALAIDIYKVEDNKHLKRVANLNEEKTSVPGFDKMFAQASASQVLKAIQLFDYTMRPRVIVIKEIPKKPRSKVKKKDVVPRLHQREIHLVLDPDEVRIIKKEAQEKGTHASPTPHVRRAHSRTFKHLMYRNMVGQTICVKESSIGVKQGEEIKVRRRIYHVVSANS